MIFNFSTSETSCAVVKRCGKPDECTVAPLNTFTTLSLSLRLVKFNMPAIDKDYKMNLFMKKNSNHQILHILRTEVVSKMATMPIYGKNL